jgi:hypothetical protein
VIKFVSDFRQIGGLKQKVEIYLFMLEEFEDTKGAIGIRKSKEEHTTR